MHLKIRRGMYCLPQSGKLVHELLEKRLHDAGYKQSILPPGFWTHKWCPISFTLCVDDVGVKYVGKQHDKHLMSTLQQNYTIFQDWTDAKYLGINIDWDYAGK